MEFSFGIVERVLAMVQNVREDRRSAFANRLKNYQKSGFPQGINTGRGRAASYGVGHLLQLGLALEMNQLGLSPERASAVIKSDMVSVAMAFSLAARNGPPAADSTAAPAFFLYLDPAALSDLMIEGVEDRAVRSFLYAGVGTLKEVLDHWDAGSPPRMSIINVSALLFGVTDQLIAAVEPMRADALYDEVSDWAATYIYQPSYGDH